MLAASVLNIFVSRAGVEMTRSVPYSDGPRRTLDVYRPVGVSGAPVVVFFYGGSWQSGSKALYRFVGMALARRGYLTVIPDYRVYPRFAFPSFWTTCACHALDARQCGAAGGNPNKLFVMGHSAGGYIAAMLALDRRWLGKVASIPIAISPD